MRRRGAGRGCPPVSMSPGLRCATTSFTYDWRALLPVLHVALWFRGRAWDDAEAWAKAGRHGAKRPAGHGGARQVTANQVTAIQQRGLGRAQPPSAHQHEFFGAGGVDGDGVVEVVEGDAALEGDGEALEDLVGGFAEGVDADDAPFVAHADEFEVAAQGGVGEGLEHGAEAAAVGLYSVAVLLAGLFLGKADAAQRRVGEDDERDVFVVKLRIGLAAEDAIHEAAGGGNGDWGEGELAGDVADGVDAFGRGVLPGVHLDGA